MTLGAGETVQDLVGLVVWRKIGFGRCNSKPTFLSWSICPSTISDFLEPPHTLHSILTAPSNQSHDACIVANYVSRQRVC